RARRHGTMWPFATARYWTSPPPDPPAPMRAIAPAVLALLGLMLGPPAGRAETVAEFYRGKQIAWILSADAGGGYSSYALAFAPFYSTHIPGNPKIIVQNMPGAGGIRAMIYLNSRAPRDGTTIGMVHSSVPFAP